MSPFSRVALFLFLTFFLSFLSYIPIIRSRTGSTRGGIFIITLMWSPGLAALITQLITRGSLRDLGWTLGSIHWLGIALLLPLVYALPVYAFTWLTGLGKFPDPSRLAKLAEKYSSTRPVITILIFLLVSLTVDMAGPLISALGEEIGWRGFLVPELIKMTSFTQTALISGIIWAIWHMPAIFLADYRNRNIPVVYSVACFTVMIIAISFPFAWLTLKSGSLWPAVLLHACHNQFIQGIFDKLTGKTKLTPYITGEFGGGLALTGLIAAYVFLRM